MYNPFSLLPLGAFIVHIFLLVYVSAQRRPGDKVHNIFMVFVTLLALWGLSDYFTWNAAIPASYLPRFALAESLFWMPTGLAFMVFVYRIIGRPLDRAVGAVAVFVAVSFIVSVTTGGLITGFSYEPWGVRQVFSVWFGPFMLLGIVVPYFWTLLLVRRMFAAGEQTELKRPLYVFFAGTAVCILTGGLNDVVLVPMLNLPSLQIASISSVSISLSMYWAVTRYNFITVNVEQVQQVFDRIFDTTGEGIMLVDRQGGILRSNQSARHLAGSGNDLSELLPVSGTDVWHDDRCEYVRNGRRILLSRTSVKEPGNPVAAIYILHDVTGDRRTEEHLYRVNAQVSEQNRFNRVRADLWRMAADTGLSEADLVKKLLDTIGPLMGVSRADFSELRDNGLVSAGEWCREGVAPSDDVVIPTVIARYFLKGDFTEINRDTVLLKIPGILRPFAEPFVTKAMQRYNIISMAYIPYEIPGYKRGLISFDINADLPEPPVWTEQKQQVVREAVAIITLSIGQRRARENLERSHDDLEERVHARTAELEASVGEKDVLLKEIHHRVKNNLQVISSLLSLQSRHLNDPRDNAMFIDSQNRIKSMALIHERLYQTGDLARVRFDTYVERLVTELCRTYSVDTGKIICNRTVAPVEMTVDRAIPCSLVVNELVSNAFKYAFAGRDKGILDIMLHRDAGTGTAELTVRDDGPGLPEGIDAENAESLGLQLVSTLTDQLDGDLTVTNDSGAVFMLRFPL